MIHIIGDSHVLCFEGAKDVTTHWLGACTAFNLWKRHKRIKEIVESNRKDTFWFCLGEIDCQRQIHNKHRETELSELFLIRNTAYLYAEYVSLFKQLSVGVMAVPPQGTVENIFGYPFYASRQHRQQISDVFNLWLENACVTNGLVFIDIWEPGWNRLEETTFVWPEEDFKEDKAHIKNEIVIKYLEEYLCQ